MSSRLELEDLPPEALLNIIDNLDSKDQLKMLLKSVDQKLVDLYTHRNTLENKKEKRSLQRLKKKIIDKLNDEASNEWLLSWHCKTT